LTVGLGEDPVLNRPPEQRVKNDRAAR
jgi:hypothetical protein